MKNYQFSPCLLKDWPFIVCDPSGFFFPCLKIRVKRHKLKEKKRKEKKRKEKKGKERKKERKINIRMLCYMLILVGSENSLLTN